MKELLMSEITKEMIEARIKETKIYASIYAVVFYILPLFIGNIDIGFIIILLITPGICFILSMLYGLQKKDTWFYLTMILILYIPSIFLYYNPIMILTGFSYTLLAWMGKYLGESISLLTKYLYKKYYKNIS